ncbi:hypothetical protein KKF84_22385 [Myxococcota bacterium]|nr:hypothetical protein [Myxococcota bacterium]MBU1538077.1 hypothetical protein [Myxococcota bacterium]
MTVKDRTGFLLTRREFVVSSGVAVIAASCDDSSGSNNANNTNNVNNNNDAGTDADIIDAQPDTGEDENIAPPPERPTTTVKETIRGVLLETAQLEDLRPAFGLTKTEAGESHIDRDDLDAISVSNGASAEPSSLAYFVHMTDIHVTDEESPARMIHSWIAEGSAWRPQEAWSSHVFNGAIATVNEFAAVRPMDFLIFSGDLTDNKHYIELRWFLDAIEGNTINPDTGDDDDPRAPGLPDPHDPYPGAGLHPDVKWFAIQGNHDLLALGNFDTLDFAVADPEGTTPTFAMSDAAIPTCFADNLDPGACVDGSCYSETPDRCFIPASDSYYQVHSTVADPNRHWIDRMAWINMVIDSNTHGPSGHGFNNDNLVEERSYWRHDEPVPGLPIALLGLDSSSAGGVTASAAGTFSQEQLDWLIEQLDDLASLNKLIVVTSHHCSRDFGTNTNAFRAALHACPNVVLHVTGHHHDNEIMPWPAPGGMDPWHGYYEIQNCGLLDWPQQMRFYELVNLGDGTGIIYSTMVNIHMEPGTTLEAARFYTLIHVQEGIGDMGSGEETDRNVAMHIAFPPSMIPVLNALPHREVETDHFIKQGESK